MAGQPNAMALHSVAPRSRQAWRYWATDGSSEASRKDASDAPAVAHTLVDMRKAAAAKVAGLAAGACAAAFGPAAAVARMPRGPEPSRMVEWVLHRPFHRA